MNDITNNDNGLGKVGTVVFQGDEDSFKEFISSLLGKQQTISDRFLGTFILTRDDVSNLDGLIDQRIKQQNKASLVSFQAVIGFDDGASVQLISLEDLLAYSEVRQVVSEELHLTWTYLIWFEGKDCPEKQEISVSFMADDFPFLRPGFSPFMFSSRYSGHIVFSIKHTARTWGGDIHSLLRDYSKGMIEEPPAVRKWVAKNSSGVSKIVGLLFLLLSTSAIYISANVKSEIGVAEVDAVLSGDPSNNYLLQLIFKYLKTGDWYQYLFMSSVYLVFVLILSFSLVLYTSSTASSVKPSYVLFTKKAEIIKDKGLRKYDRIWSRFYYSIVTSVVGGIICNVLFYQLTGK